MKITLSTFMLFFISLSGNKSGGVSLHKHWTLHKMLKRCNVNLNVFARAILMVDEFMKKR